MVSRIYNKVFRKVIYVFTVFSLLSNLPLNLYSQTEDCISVVVTTAGERFTIPVNPDQIIIRSDHQPFSLDAVCIEIILPGYYKIFSGIEYSTDQGNESFYLLFRSADNQFADLLDPNAGPYRVVADTSFLPFTASRYTGEYYLTQGNYTINLNHYYLLQEQFPDFLNPPGQLMVSDNPQSIHFYNFVLEYQGESFRQYDLSISKSATKDSAAVEENISFNLIVENHGPDSAADIRVLDAMPDFTTASDFVPAPDSVADNVCWWKVASLEVDQNFTISYSARIDPAVPDSIQTILNSAEVRAADDINSDNNQAEAAVHIKRDHTPPERNCDLSLEKFASTDTVDHAEAFLYSLQIKNWGRNTAFEIALIDTVPEFISLSEFSIAPDSSFGNLLFWFFDSLTANEQQSVTFSARSNQLPSTSIMTVINAAFVNAVNDTNLANNSDRSLVTLIDEQPEPRLNFDLSVTKTASHDSLSPGEIFHYFLKIENLGPALAKNVTLVDTLPDLIETLNVIPAPDSSEQQRLYWFFDSLLVGEVRTVAIEAVVANRLPDSIVSIFNSAQIEAANDTNLVNNFSMVENFASALPQPHPAIDLSLSKTVSVDTVRPGEQFYYLLTVKNLGPVPAGNFSIIDTLPNLIAPTNFSIEPDSAADNLLFWFFDSLDIGQLVTISFASAIEPLEQDTSFQLINRAAVYAEMDSNRSNDHDEASIYVVQKNMVPELNYDLALQKTTDRDTVHSGENLNYSLLLENLGPETAFAITVVDTLPEFISVANSIPAPDSTAGNLLFWEFDSLHFDERLTISLSAIADSQFPAQTIELYNSALVSASNDTNAANNHSSATVFGIDGSAPASVHFDLLLSKVVNKDTAYCGQRLSYHLKLTNLGPALATQIVLVDTLPELLTPLGFNRTPDSTSGNIYFWNFDTLLVGNEIDLSLLTVLNNNFPDSITLVRNGALVVAANDTNRSNDYAFARTVAIRRSDIPDKTYHLQLTKTADQDSVEVGEEFHFEIKVKNLGPDEACQVTLVDSMPVCFDVTGLNPLPDSVNGNVYFWNFELIRLNEEKIVTIAVKLTADCADSAAELSNVAAIIGSDDPNNIGQKTREKIIILEDPVIPDPDFELRLTKTADRDSVQVGEEFHFEIRVKNLGPDVANQVALVDSMPVCFNMIGCDPLPDSVKANVYFWNFDSIEVNQEKVVMITVSLSADCADSTADLSNVAIIIDADDPNNIGKRTRAKIIILEYPVDPDEDFELRLTKTTDCDTVTINQSFSYEIKLENLGPGTAYDVTVVDSLPALLSYSNFVPEPDSSFDNVVIWKFDSLSAGQTKTMTYSAVCTQAISDSNLALDNVVLVAASNDTNLIGERATRKRIIIEEQKPVIYHYNLGLSKDADKDTVIAGESFVYFLTIINYGPHTAFDITLVDSLPELITASNFNPEPDSLSGNLLFWFFDSLHAGDRIVVSFTATLEATLPKIIMPIMNVAGVSAPGDTDVVDNSDEEEIYGNRDELCEDCDRAYYFDENLFEPDLGKPLSIFFGLTTAQLIRLDLYDISGYFITTLTENFYNRGFNKYLWNGKINNGQQIGSGVYVIALRTQRLNCWKKVIVVR